MNKKLNLISEPKMKTNNSIHTESICKKISESNVIMHNKLCTIIPEVIVGTSSSHLGTTGTKFSSEHACRNSYADKLINELDMRKRL